MTRVHEPRPPREPVIFDDVLPDDLPEAELTENARIVLGRRYLKKDADGEPTEEPEVMFWRVARTIADVDAEYGASESAVDEVARQFYDLMINGKFEPNSPTLMNAGRPLGQLSACFVLPVDDALSNGQSGIYDTLKSMALVHQSGGGCVAGDAHVHTTFCGVETIETLYERVRALEVPEQTHSDHAIMDVRHLGIDTMALDPGTGRFVPKSVTHLWRWDVPAKDQYTVRCLDGSEVTTSAWHPFMVFTDEGVVERRADGLRAGDILVKPNRSVRDTWPFAEPKEVAGLIVNEELAWLVGYFLGDGSLDVFRNRTNDYEALRLRFFDGRPESIEFAAKILGRHGIDVTPQQDGRGLWRLTTTNQDFVPAFARVAEAVPGPKDDLTLPEWVGKSPLSVVAAFLGGLIDSDAHVSVSRRRIVYSTVCSRLARRLTSLMSTLGFDPAHRTKAPAGKAKRVEHRVQLANAKKTHELAALVSDWVHDTLRGRRLGDLAQPVEHNTHPRLPLPFSVLEPLLEAAGVPISGTAIHREPIMVDGEPFWLHRTKWGLGIGEDKLASLARALRGVLPAAYEDRLEKLERLSDGWAVVEEAAPTDEPKAFYDFTVEDLNTYLAGGGDGRMLVIHNTGFSFSRLRPEGHTVRSTMGVASGPVSFMKLYDASTDVVKQGGTRRGANMGILRVDHPDIRTFITCKNDTSQITNFNISVAITDAFMDAVANDGDYDLIDPRSGEVTGQESAREIFDMVVHGAWLTGEPGTFFIDRANADNPVPRLGSYEATNPCGEQVLLPYDVCNLGSINLGKFVKDDARPGTDPDEAIDWDALRTVVHLATHFLDNVIDANVYPLPDIHDLAQQIRRIGLGVMGWADMLVRIGVPYDSTEGVELGRRVMEFVNEEARSASEKLAETRGVFPAWAESIWGPDETAAKRAEGERIRPMRELRNCNLTTVAPTGTISIFAGCSGGIEPLFAVAFMRNQAGAMMPDVNPDFVRMAEEGGWYSEELMERIAADGHIHFDEVPEEVQRIFRTAHDITPEWHVRMQAAFQEHVDAAISKCIAAGTLVPTDRGLIAVEAFADEHAPDTFADTKGEYRTGGHRILSHYRAGQKPATRIRLDNGSELTGATESHRVLTPDGWRLMSELRPGDMVLGRFEESHGPGGRELGWEDSFLTAATHLATPDTMSPELARFLGMVAADGYTLELDGRVELTCKDASVEEEFTRLCSVIFRTEPKRTVDRRNGVTRLYLTSRNLVRFVESLIGSGAYEKRAPTAVLQGSFEEKLNFLEGVTLDGHKTPQGLVLYAGMSETLAYHVAEIARSFGMPRVNQGRKWVKASEAYAHDVVVSNEMQELVTPIEAHKRGAAVYKRYKVLADVAAVARSAYPSTSTQYYALRTAQNEGRRHLFNTTAQSLGLPADTPVHRVTEVEDAGVVELYDVEVEDAHEYVVNGMVSHNTTNFPRKATEDDVREIYELAFQLGCKGVTVYRDGSRDGQVLSTGATDKKEAAAEVSVEIADLQHQLADAREEAHNLRIEVESLKAELEDRDETARAARHKRQRPEALRGYTMKMMSPLGDLYVTINEDVNGRPFEVFCTLGKAGGAAMADAEAIGRLMSLALRSGISINQVKDQLRGISCDRAVGLGPNKVLSVPDAIGQAIDRYLEEKEGVQEALPLTVGTGDGGASPETSGAPAGGDLFDMGTCPDCGTGHLAFEEGCKKCHVCGYSECG